MKVDVFISIVNSDTIAAIFVHPSKQGLGIGGKLITLAKENSNSLSLTVYSKNMKSRSFYKKHVFVDETERIDEATGESEIVMRWSKGADKY